ncbi:MAG: DUF6443 domain-containing protein [Raineya sp.]|jgi:RHS repeat-associated protein|nr:DUF6443 domain-containing protein [Raineya sp.]
MSLIYKKIVLFLIIFCSIGYLHAQIVGQITVDEGATETYTATGSFSNPSVIVTGGSLVGTPGGNPLTFQIKWNCNVTSGVVLFKRNPTAPTITVNVTIRSVSNGINNLSNLSSYLNQEGCGNPSIVNFRVGDLLNAMTDINSIYNILLSTTTFKVYNAASGGSAIYTETRSKNGSPNYSGWLYSVNVNTSQTIYITFTGTTGCETPRYAVNLTAVSRPPLVNTVQEGKNFEGQGAILSITPLSGSYTYNWYDGVTLVGTGTSYTTPTNLPVGERTYYVRTVQTVAGAPCESTLGKEVKATIWAKPQILIKGGMLTENGKNVQLTTTEGYDTYSWKEVGVSTILSTTSRLTLNRTGTFEVTVTRQGGVSTSLGFTIQQSHLESTINANEHYVIVHSPKIPVSTYNSIAQLGVGEVSQTVVYLDGFGRPKQSVATQASVNQTDIVLPYAYDYLGRQPRQYLAYVSTDNTGEFKGDALTKQGQFYGTTEGWNTTDKRAKTAYPYSESVYLNEVSTYLGESSAPGAAWKIDRNAGGQTTLNGKTAKSDVQIVDATEAATIRRWDYDFATGNATTTTNYGASDLVMSISVDVKNRKTWAYSDKEGKVVYQKIPNNVAATDFVEMYYVYDDFGQLRLMINPKGVELLQGNGWNLTTTILDEFCYKYQYDKYGRTTRKKVAGKGEEWFVYNRRGQLVMSQDAMQRVKSTPEWNFSKSDVWGRTLMSGTLTSTQSQTDLQTSANSATYLFESRTNSTTHGYTNQAFPSITGAKVFGVSYYDDYDFDNNPSTPSNVAYETVSQIPTPTLLTELQMYGMMTASKTWIESTNSWLWTYVIYDKYGRAIQTQADNHLGGKETTTLDLDWLGTLRQDFSRHTTNLAGSTPTEILNTYTYDHEGRFLSKTQKINNQTPEKMTEVGYNTLGQAIWKKIGNNLQKIDYRYNIQGWLTHINKADLSAEDAGDPTDVWGMELFYEDVSGLSDARAEARFDGMIAGVKWKSSLDNVERKYVYVYDDLDRLKNAYYEDNQSLAGVLKPDYFEGNLTYDKNGNILSLDRNGLTGYDGLGRANYGGVDRLTYTYQGNKLKKVADAATTANKGFVDGANTDDDYAYDLNGNMVSDKNKGITSITYNSVAQPLEINFADGRKVTYTYAGNVIKLTKKVFNSGGSVTSQIDYAGAYIYESSKLSFIHLTEGKAIRKTDGTFQYEYHISDHQGNLRVAIQAPVNSTAFTSLETEDPNGYQNVATSRSEDIAYTGQSSSKTQPSQQTGVYRSILVGKGDVVNMKAYARYTQDATNNNNVLNVLPTITQLPNGENGSTWALGVGLNYTPNQNPNAGLPRAYIKWILYDEQGNYLQSGEKAISSVAKTSWEELTLSVNVPNNGVFQYLVANESDRAVYFDNVEMTHNPHIIVQENHYTPFGVDLEGIGKAGNHAYLYNQGTEKDKTTGYYETEFRRYDAHIGRFTGIDALAESYGGITPYQYALNNPVMYNDPTGLASDWGFNWGAFYQKNAGFIYSSWIRLNRSAAIDDAMEAYYNSGTSKRSSNGGGGNNNLNSTNNVRPKYSNIKVTSKDNITFYVTGNVDIDLKVINLSSLDNMSLPVNIDTYASDVDSWLEAVLSQTGKTSTVRTTVKMIKGEPVWEDYGKMTTQTWIYDMNVTVNTRVIKSIYDINQDDYVLAVVDKYDEVTATDIKGNPKLTPVGMSNGNKIATIGVYNITTRRAIHEILHSFGLDHVWKETPGDNPDAPFNIMDYWQFQGDNVADFQIYDIWNKNSLGPRGLSDGFKAKDIPWKSWYVGKSQHSRDLLVNFINDTKSKIHYDKSKAR